MLFSEPDACCIDERSLAGRPIQHPDNLSIRSEACTLHHRGLRQDIFPYLSLDQEAFWQHLDLLVYFEGTIYQLDDENEACTEAGIPPERVLPQGCGLVVLRQVLADCSILDERLDLLLEQGAAYWQQERNLCAAMLGRQPGIVCSFTHEDVLAASAGKSFDYRAMHVLMLNLTGKQYDDTIFRFLEVDERLVDIGDDLVDYEDDILRNSFNILRGFVHLYGHHAAIELVKVISGLEAQLNDLLHQLSKTHQQHHLHRHQQASKQPGSGTWVFPKLILDETAFRRQQQCVQE